MAAKLYTLHAVAPERRKLAEAAQVLKQGGVILYPTDTSYALGCELADREAIARLRAIRGLDESKALTFLCASLSNVAEFANVSDRAYATIRRLVPGPYTFILPATKLVPRYAQNPKRRTAGLRVPEDKLSHLLLELLGAPVLSITAKDADGAYYQEPDELMRVFGKRVDMILTLDHYLPTGESTVVDMTSDDFTVLREGAGIEVLRELLK